MQPERSSRMLSRAILSIFIVVSCRAHAHADVDISKCMPDQIGIYRADDQAYEYVDVHWKGKKYRKYFKGRVADHGKNEEKLTEWLLSLPENECNPSRS